MMTIRFYLRFHSTYKQSFFIKGNIPELGNGDTTKAFPLHYLNNEFWYGSIEIDEKHIKQIKYNYILYTDDIETLEGDNDRMIDTTLFSGNNLQIIDTWNFPGEFQNAFYTQPFQQILLKSTDSPASISHFKKNDTHVFRVKTPLLAEDETLCITGSSNELNQWETARPLVMSKENNWYAISFDLSKAKFPIAYKYGVWNKKKNLFVRFEDGNNRVLHNDINKREITILHDGFAHLPNNSFHGAGVAIPVFSLKTNNSFGVGEFEDIKLLVDWAKQIGLKLIQLLPINDTTATHTWADSYPYAAISAFALHPLYASIDKIAGKKHSNIIKSFNNKKSQYNNLPEIDYEEVMQYKWQALKDLYTVMKEEWKVDTNYLSFYSHNKHWLLPYAAFCFLRDENKTVDFSKWKKHATYVAADIEKMAQPENKSYDKIAIHLFTQYHLHLQLTEAVAYAHKNGVIMKGDIPIGVYRNSCDVWINPHLFDTSTQAGAPPDDFAVKGQNWGFPIYNWQKMQEDNFNWWKQRFKQMSFYFDAFRIDHILGFFRIWSIPMDAVEGIMGRFVPCIPVRISEFSENGIWFDYDRYCKPFINDMILGELFGEKAEWIKERFTENNGWGQYKLKDMFDTQRKVEEWFATQTDIESWIKEKLFDLISNVILFEDADSLGNAFHFRINMDHTTSFRYLDDYTKKQLKELYVNYFFHRQNEFWKRQAMQKLPALKASTNMLICGEDLGMVPDCVPDVMKELGLLSLEIQRMPKKPTKKFFHPSDAPYMSVVTPSTHDMSTVRGWWEENRDITQQFYHYELGKSEDAPYFCEPWINKEVIIQHLYSPAMWSIFQLQDLIGIDGNLRRENPGDERINVPANPCHYWRYRMHIHIEDLIKNSEFNTVLKGLIKESGR